MKTYYDNYDIHTSEYRGKVRDRKSRWTKLTPREREVAMLICKENGGKMYTNPQIAEKLGISRETVKIHVRNILYKFELHSKFELRNSLVNWEIPEAS
jgi:DNA-binding CsgD family transcriptional regulator